MQESACVMRIGGWSSDVCSSDVHDHAFVVVYVGSGDGSARADVAHHETDFVSDDAVGGDWALLGFAAVVDDHGFELLAVDAAGGIDAFDRGVDAFAHHGAVLDRKSTRLNSSH